MKKNIFIKGLAGVAVAAMMSSCAEDYLDLAPITQISTEQVTSTVDVATNTFYGLIEGMYTQYGSWAGSMPRSAMLNGEPLLQVYYGEGGGADAFYGLWPQLGTGEYITNWTGMNLDGYIFTNAGWIYSYTLISMANQILTGIDNAEGDAGLRDYIKAGTLTIRAHAYTRLLQIFGPRWEDSNNGEELVCVLRLKPTTTDLPLESMNNILNQIYADLDEAIALYENCGVKRSAAEPWEPDIHVAMGVYARAAMLKHDFRKAQKMAHDARQSFPIMSADEYKAGFCVANGEWMWTNILDDFLYYYAHGSFYACNGAYPNIWGVIGAGAINYDLYRQVPAGDIRRDLYLTPDKVKVAEEAFWNSKTTVDATNMNLFKKNRQLKMQIQNMSTKMRPNASWPAAYADHRSEGEKDGELDLLVPFGAQYKFWCVDDYGTNQFPFMRAAEMLLTEAEAAYENGEFPVAKSCLEELNAKRQEGYTCSTSGTALRDEIRLYRRIELWGEGHSWFDLKRWNVNCTRRAWIEGDVNSNNIPAAYAIDKKPSDNNGWRFVVPRTETQYNELVK